MSPTLEIFYEIKCTNSYTLELMPTTDCKVKFTIRNAQGDKVAEAEVRDMEYFKQGIEFMKVWTKAKGMPTHN